MELATTLILAGILVFIFIQDFKNRAVHILLLMGLFLMALVVNYTSNNIGLLDMACNALFVLVNMLGLLLYFSLKQRRFINPIDTYLGLGDIVFFIAVTPLFDFKSYILFFIFGLFFSLIVHVGLKWFQKMATIPLAGYLSLFLILDMVNKHVFKSNVLF